VRRSPRIRTRSWYLESRATGYRRLRKIVQSAENRENSKSRCRRRCEEGAESGEVIGAAAERVKEDRFDLRRRWRNKCEIGDKVRPLSEPIHDFQET